MRTNTLELIIIEYDWDIMVVSRFHLGLRSYLYYLFLNNIKVWHNKCWFLKECLLFLQIFWWFLLYIKLLHYICWLLLIVKFILFVCVRDRTWGLQMFKLPCELRIYGRGGSDTKVLGGWGILLHIYREGESIILITTLQVCLPEGPEPRQWGMIIFFYLNVKVHLWI